MVKRNDVVQGIIEKIDTQGMGVFFANKEKVMVRNVVAQEKVQVRIEKRVKEGFVGSLQKVIIPSNDRVKVACPSFVQCGSCHLLHVGYAKQLEMKTTMIKDMVDKAKMKHIKVDACVGMQHPYAYRNKIIISFKGNKKEVIAGFYEEFSHKIIPIKQCLLHEDYSNTLIESVKDIVKKCRIEAFNEDSGYGYLRHILIRRGVKTNQTMLVLVGANKIFKAKKNFIKMMKEKHPEIQTVILNVNSRRTSVVLGDYEEVLYGKGYIEDILCGKRFKISSKSFYQINHEQCEKLYTKALSLISENSIQTMIDAYCGVGTIGIIAAYKAKQVLGVELNKDAIKDAIYNAKNNGVQNVRFTCADAGKYMVSLARERKSIDVVIMDPAREGSDEAFLSSLVKLGPKEVVYISCNPQTQIRDIKYLERFGYKTDTMYLYDLFPHTFHVESIVKLVKR